MSIVKVFTNQGADGNSTVVVLPKDTNRSADMRAADVNLYGQGNFGGGTLRLQASPDGGVTWVNVVSLTAEGVSRVRLVATRVRATLTGATTPALNAWIGFGSVP